MRGPIIAVINDEDSFLALMTDVFSGEGYAVATGMLAGEELFAAVLRTERMLLALLHAMDEE